MLAVLGLGSAPKVVPGLNAPMYFQPGQAAALARQYEQLQRQGLPLAPYIEHGSWRTGQPSIFRYGRDPYRGVMGTDVPPGPAPAPNPMQRMGPLFGLYTLLRPIASAAMAYHGYRRHRGSTGWAIAWSLAGGAFPLVSTGIALAQGFGKPMKGR